MPGARLELASLAAAPFEDAVYTGSTIRARATEPNLGPMSDKRPKRLVRLLSFGALIAAIAAFRHRKLASEEAKFDR